MCGIFGITGHPMAKKFLPIALNALQHRGHDAAGVAGFVSENFNTLKSIKGLGRVSTVVTEKELSRFEDFTFIAHTRYSTRNESASLHEIHPHFSNSLQGRMALASNGDLIEVDKHLDYLKSKKVKTYTRNDAEVLTALINYKVRFEKKEVLQSIQETMEAAKGGFAATLLIEDDNNLYAFRDQWGIRPLHIAEIKMDGKSCVAISSETCAFDIIERYFTSNYSHQEFELNQRVVNPGEIVSIDLNGNIKSVQTNPANNKKVGCVFEAIYFSRPDSLHFSDTYQVLREKMGEELFREAPVDADLVTPVPKGGIPSAIGYANASNLPYSIGIMEEPSTGGLRSFTTNDDQRISLAGMKYNILKDTVKDKKIVVVDDSIVRGTTMRLLVKHLYNAGAKEVHLRIPCPPYSHPCHYGIATQDPKSLISFNKSVDQICEELGATSLAYLSIEGLYRVMGKSRELYCDECLTGRTPFEV